MKRRQANFVHAVAVGLVIAHSFAVPLKGEAADQQKPGVKQKSENSAPAQAADNPRQVLSEDQWRHVDDAVERALTWLASQQRDDGSFPTLDTGQPAVTALCMFAYMAHGHLPNDGGPYGQRLRRAMEYVLDRQKENGLIALMGPEGAAIDRIVNQEIGVTTAYNHAISSLTISEVYGMGVTDKDKRLQKAIAKSLAATLEMQRWPRRREEDKGGWRYVNDFGPYESDLSLTGWQLMFLRSARNGGFDVPKEAIENAVGYVRRSFTKRYGTFTYNIAPIDTRSRAMAGAGILALAHAGLHESAEARASGDWLLQQKFDVYNRVEPFTTTVWQHDRYHYAVFYACQGTYQLGGRYWSEFFPRIVPVLLNNQQSIGAWSPESHPNDGRYGNAYTTALMVLSLGAPNQLLPVFQR